MYYITYLYNLVTTLCFRCYHYFILPLRYKITVVGLENLDSQKLSPDAGMLFLSNHPSHLDASLIGTALIKEGHLVSIWTMDFVFKNPYTRLVARNSDSTKLLKVPNVHENRSPKNLVKVRRLIRRTVEGLQEGENVLFFPAGYQKFTSHEEVNGKSAVQRILKQYPQANIVLVRITGMWGSRFSKAVSKFERSDLREGQWVRFIWKIAKIFLLNGIFFIPKRRLTIEFLPVGPDFPRHGTRREINQYIEDFFNKGFSNRGEPLQRVPDYFWKAQYPSHEYHLKGYNYDLTKVPQAIVQDIISHVAQKAQMKPENVKFNMLLDRDLCLDSLEMTELFIDLEKKYPMPKLMPKNVSSVGHLIALASGQPIAYDPICGTFQVVHEEPILAVKAWHACAGLVAGFFGFLDLHR